MKDRPEKVSKALNYLLVGSDTREGLTKAQIKQLKVGSTAVAAGGRSDTMLLLHISKSRDRAYLISLPRDSLVTIPEHVSSRDNKTVVGPASGKLNWAFAYGGAPLLIRTIEGATNLKIDHYIEISFAGFAGMVDALGGVEVCTKVDIDDPKSHLVLPAGVHTLDGIEALKQYQFAYDEDKKIYRSKPRHDWTSHGSDAFEIIGQVWREKQPPKKPDKPRFLDQMTADELFWPQKNKRNIKNISTQ